MIDPGFRVQCGQQLTFERDEVVEISLKVGIIPSADHCQFQLLCVDPRTQTVISLSSRPHVDLESAMGELSNWIGHLQAEVWDMVGPF